MKPTLLRVAVLVVQGAVVLLAGAGHIRADDIDEGKETADVKAVALVTTQPLAEHELCEAVSGFGSATASGGALLNVTFPRPIEIKKIHALVGQTVHAGDILLDVATDSASRLAFREAQLARKAAEADLDRTKDLFSRQLATKAQVAAAEKARADAAETLRAQEEIGAGAASSVYKSPVDGTIVALGVASGDRLQAGAQVMQIAAADARTVVLGVEPQEARKVQPGMAATITAALDDTASARGQVESVAGALNKDTQLVDVWVRLAENPFFSGAKVTGKIITRSEKAPAVPTSAVLSDEKGTYLFVVEGGKAKRVDVKTGLAAGGLIEVHSALPGGAEVVTLGNYELEDGMAVRQESAH